MTKRQPKKILPTMKIKAKKETDLAFEECQAEITSINDVETEKFGSKIVANLKRTSDDFEFAVFVNNYSIENLTEAYGEEDKNWIGKLVNLVKEEDKQFNNDMIVLTAVK